jgi:5,10-methylenetetrahydromethanopterin reductase
LLIGTWGRETARWAGTVADEVKIGGTANAELLPVVRGWISSPGVGLVVGCVTVVDEDGDRARAHAASVVRPYLDVVARHDPTLEPGDEPRLERYCIAGTPEEVAERVVELWEAGADRVELGTPQGSTTLAGVDLICDRVLPLVAR